MNKVGNLQVRQPLLPKTHNILDVELRGRCGDLARALVLKPEISSTPISIQP